MYIFQKSQFGYFKFGLLNSLNIDTIDLKPIHLNNIHKIDEN